jgi:RNA polymerase sigma-70 factor (ECF subfamily)
MTERDVNDVQPDETGTREDAELILALSRREDDALEQLYDRYVGLCMALAYRMLGERQAAEDVVQEAFLNVWRSAATYDPTRSGARSWLVSIVRNRCIDRVRGKAVRPQLAGEEGIADKPGGHDVWKEVAQSLSREEIRGALDQLPKEQRDTLELAYFAGLTQVEIAERMGVPLGTVKGRVRISLQRLRGLLGGLEPDEVS